MVQQVTVVNDIDVSYSIFKKSCIDDDFLCDGCFNPFGELRQMLLERRVVGHG